MNSQDSTIEDDQFLDSLIDETLVDQDRDETRFTHAFIDASLKDVLSAIRSGAHSGAPPNIPIFGTAPTIANATVYLTSVDGGALLWMPQKSLAIAPIVSRELGKPVHWISVYEIFTCRAYVQFEGDRIVHEVLDPAEYWTQNILHGDDLIGKGVRRFESYAAFKESIKKEYQPNDELIDFEKIEECLVNSDPNVLDSRKVVRARVDRPVLEIEFLGQWLNDEIEAVKESGK